ncbi:MAG: DUF1800 domain-containing protein [Gemmatimonadota bacterium]
MPGLRDFVSISLATLVLVASPPREELSPRERTLHALNRLTFGPGPEDIEKVERTGLNRWIETQLHPERIDDGAMSAVLARYPAVSKTASQLIAEFPPPNVIRRQREDAMTREDTLRLRRELMENRGFVAEVMGARVARAVGTERQLEEVMVDFWLNHFSVFVGRNQQMRYHLPEFERTIRRHAFGRFRDLLGAVSHSPAMLIYLDNAQSVADSTQPTLVSRDVAERRRRAVLRAPRVTDEQRAALEQLQQRRPRGINENYARELLELHTLGVDGGYTQQDVIEVARALTGWTVAPPRLARSRSQPEGFVFNAAAHDAGEKVVLGHRLAPGRGEADGNEVLDLLARHPSTASHIAHKLATRFVSDSPPQALVERAAATFTRTNGDVRAVLRTIVTSPEFFSRAAYRAKVKSPFEVVVSAVRALGGKSDSTPLTAGIVARLGQPIYGRQTPDGWPETGGEWMNTGAILNRINFGMLVASGRLPGVSLSAWPAFGRLESLARERQVDGVVEGVLGGAVSSETREILISGNNPMASAAAEVDSLTDPAMSSGVNVRRAEGGARAGDAGRPRPGSRNPGARAVLGGDASITGLNQIIGLALGAPEFQRR